MACKGQSCLAFDDFLEDFKPMTGLMEGMVL